MINFVPIAIGMNVSKNLFLIGFEIVDTEFYRKNSINFFEKNKI